MKKEIIRCPWPTQPNMIRYHDEEWGVPVHDDRLLFEFLILEGAQAGLSWQTVLNKRENYRAAFDNFDAEKNRALRRKENCATTRRRRHHPQSSENPRDDSKRPSVSESAREIWQLRQYLWQFVGGKPIVNCLKTMKEIQPRTKISDAMSKDLLKRGFKFVGSTICYANMQAVGMVNDHLVTCFRHKQLS
ncbi:MAG: DNA-3-methyladenine glycosylase I [Limisphaerales bacterium]